MKENLSEEKRIVPVGLFITFCLVAGAYFGFGYTFSYALKNITGYKEVNVIETTVSSNVPPVVNNPTPQPVLSPSATPSLELKEYWTIQLCSLKTKEEGDIYLTSIQGSSIYAKKDKKNNYWFVVVVGKYRTEKEANKEIPKLKEKWKENSELWKGIKGSFPVLSTKLEDPSIIPDTEKTIIIGDGQGSPTPEATEEPTPVPLPSSDSSLTDYKTVQVASKEVKEEAEDISSKIPDSFIMAKYSKKQNKYFYAVLVGRFSTEEDASLYMNYIKENYSSAGTEKDIPSAFVVDSSSLESVDVIHQQSSVTKKSMFKVRIGAYNSKNEAEQKAKELEGLGYNVFVIEEPEGAYVQVGSFKEQEKALTLAEEISQKGYSVIIRQIEE